MGYETAAFTANPWTSRSFGFNKGFDHFEDFMEDTTSNRLRNGDGGDSGPVREMFMSWESFYDDIERWRRSAEEPYIPPKECLSLWLLTYASNAWLFGGADDRLSPLFRDQLLSAYDKTIEYTDEFVATLVDDVGDDSIVCVHGGHGELFGDEGRYGHGYLHESVINVPLVVGNVPSECVEDPVSLQSLPELLTGLAAGDRRSNGRT